MKIKFNDVHIASYKGGNSPSEITKPGVYTLVIDYPLTKPARFEIKVGKKGMSNEELTLKIIKAYKHVYKKEAATSKIPPGYIPGMFNRNRTDGCYGIWGHVIDDLVLVRARVSKHNVIHLEVDS